MRSMKNIYCIPNNTYISYLRMKSSAIFHLWILCHHQLVWSAGSSAMLHTIFAADFKGIFRSSFPERRIEDNPPESSHALSHQTTPPFTVVRSRPYHVHITIISRKGFPTTLNQATKCLVVIREGKANGEQSSRFNPSIRCSPSMLNCEHCILC